MLWGTSFGGGHVARTAAKHPELLGAITQVPMLDGMAAVKAVPPLRKIRFVLYALADLIRGKRNPVNATARQKPCKAVWRPGSKQDCQRLCPGFTATDMIAKEGGGHMSLPFVPILTAQQVAAEGYDALMKGKPVHINGRANQLVEAFVTRQPRWITHRVSRALRHRGL